MRRSGQFEGKIRYEVLEEFRYEIRRFLNFSERVARQAGIEPHQHQALLAIKAATRRTRASIGFLAERLLIQHHSAVELCNRLEGKKLVRRSRSSADRREVLLRLTPAGENLLESLSVLHRTELQTTGPRLLKALRNVVLRAGRAGGSGEPGQADSGMIGRAFPPKLRKPRPSVARSETPRKPKKRS